VLHQSDLWQFTLLLGLLSGVVGRTRHEKPKSLSTIGLFANVAILVILGILLLIASVMFGGPI
jgi:hypothetical protein